MGRVRLVCIWYICCFVFRESVFGIFVVLYFVSVFGVFVVLYFVRVFDIFFSIGKIFT